MRALIDTHAFIWWMDANPRLSSRAREALANEPNECLFSIASVWEMAIKISLGRMVGRGRLDRDLPEQLAANGLALLPISLAHVTRVADLPFHHRDPFDRLLIAQALVEGVPVVTVDEVFNDYGVDRIW